MSIFSIFSPFFTFFTFFCFFRFFSLNFRFASIFSLNFRLFYLRFRFRFLVFRIEVNHVKSGLFFASKRNKIFTLISNFASETKVRAHPTLHYYTDNLCYMIVDDVHLLSSSVFTLWYKNILNTYILIYTHTIHTLTFPHSWLSE
jgi:hypothetical protein